jgi:hypothetical protein
VLSLRCLRELGPGILFSWCFLKPATEFPVPAMLSGIRSFVQNPGRCSTDLRSFGPFLLQQKEIPVRRRQSRPLGRMECFSSEKRAGVVRQPITIDFKRDAKRKSGMRKVNGGIALSTWFHPPPAPTSAFVILIRGLAF